MRAIFRNITFIRNFLTMLGGSVVARLITVGVTPILSRMFDPDMFGVAAIFSALVFLLTTVATLRYDQAIVLVGQESEAAGLSRLTMLILGGFCVLFTAVALAILIFDVPLGRYSSLGPWLMLVPIGVLLTGITEILRSRIIRRKRFARAAQSELVLATGSAGARIGGGLALGSSAVVLIVGNLLGMLARLLFLVFEFRSGSATERVTNADLKRLGREHRQFPLFATPTAFLRTLSDNLPVLAFGILYAPAVVGFYAFARRLVALPAVTINRAIRQVYLQKVAELHNAGRGTRGAFIKTTFVLLLVGILPTAALMFFGEPLFGWVLGERWTTAGHYAEIISPWVLFTVASAPASATYMVFRRQQRLLFIHTVLTLIRILIFVAAYVQGLDVAIILVLLSASGVVGYIWIIVTAWAIADEPRVETSIPES